MFDSDEAYNDDKLQEDDDEQNSLVTSMNGEVSKVYKRISNVPQAPLVSQISDNEDEELERIIREP